MARSKRTISEAELTKLFIGLRAKRRASYAGIEQAGLKANWSKLEEELDTMDMVRDAITKFMDGGN